MTYLLYFTVEVASAEDVTLTVPLVIGTIPLRTETKPPPYAPERPPPPALSPLKVRPQTIRTQFNWGVVLQMPSSTAVGGERPVAPSAPPMEGAAGPSSSGFSFPGAPPPSAPPLVGPPPSYQVRFPFLSSLATIRL